MKNAAEVEAATEAQKVADDHENVAQERDATATAQAAVDVQIVTDAQALILTWIVTLSLTLTIL